MRHLNYISVVLILLLQLGCFGCLQGPTGPQGPEGQQGSEGQQGLPGFIYPEGSGFHYFLLPVDGQWHFGTLYWSPRFEVYGEWLGESEVQFSIAELDGKRGIFVCPDSRCSLYPLDAQYFDDIKEIPQTGRVTQDFVGKSAAKFYVLLDWYNRYSKIKVQVSSATEQYVQIKVMCLYYNSIAPDFKLNKPVP